MKQKLNHDAFDEIRTSPKVWDMLEELADDAINEASEGGRVEGYSRSSQLTREKRAAVTIVGKGHARNHNLKHNALLKALDRVSDELGRVKRR